MTRFFAYLLSPKSNGLTIPLVAFIASRLLILLVMVAANTSLPSNYAEGVYGGDAWKTTGFTGLWMRWDSPWYVEIAEDGYWFLPGELSPVSWFPVYPLLMRFFAPIFGNPLVAGLVISNLCFLLSLILLYQLVLLEAERPSLARRTVIYLSIFPTSLFFSAVYTESIFLLLSLIAAYYARRQRWGIASLAGFVAAMTRLPGVFVGLLVGIEWLEAQGWRLNRAHQLDAYRGLRQGRSSAWMIAAIPLGLAVYLGYLALDFGDPLIFLKSTGANAQRLGGPIAALTGEIEHLLDGRLQYPYNWPFDVFMFFFVLVAAVIVSRRLRLSYGVYAAASVLLAIWSGRTRSMTRYAVVLFPVFILLAYWGQNRRTDLVLKTLFLLGLAINTALFVKWFFVG